MPVMDFLTQGNDEELHAIGLSSVLYFPSPADDQAREDWVLAQLLASAADLFEPANSMSQKEAEKLSQSIGAWLGLRLCYYGGWGGLANAAIARPIKHDEIRRNWGYGLLSGLILMFLLEKKVASLGTAIQLGIDLLTKRYSRCVMQAKFPSQNFNTIEQRIWPRFRPSAHIWAALSGSKGVVTKRPWTRLQVEKHPGGIPGLLAEADQFRIAGENRLPTTSNKPVLRPEEVWTVPGGYYLPSIDTLPQLA